MSDQESNDEEEKELIHYSGNYGGITQESKFWDDFEEMGEKELLKLKIIKIKIFLGKYNEKDCISGINVTFKNIITGEIKNTGDHKGSDDFIDVKEININGDEYLTDFHIRFTNDAEYISQLGYSTNKKNKILVGTEEGEDKTLELNGGKNIILGTFGCTDNKLGATGIYYINKKEFIKKRCFGLIMLNHLIKTDEQFKKETQNNYNKLSDDYKYFWKTVNLPDAAFSQVIKFCSI